MAIEVVNPSTKYRRPLLVIVLVLAIIFGLSRWQLNTFVITPGTATNVPPLIKVDTLKTNAKPDSIMLVDVYLSQLNAWTWLLSKFQSHQEFVNATDLVEPGISIRQLNDQGYLQMQDAKQAAEVSALRALGWKLNLKPAGSIVTGVYTGSPAAKAGLNVGDEIVKINATPITNSCDLLFAISKLPAKSHLVALVKKVKYTATGVMSWAAPKSVSLTTGRVAKSQSADSCGGKVVQRSSYIGVSSEDGVDVTLPANITINTNYIGGPSAGLAMTLSLIDKLSAGSLTGGKAIAVTGTMDLAGNVGDVGGVAEKVVAVSATKAQYFIVPKSEVAAARSNARPGLKIIGVSTLSEVLRILHSLGGSPVRALTPPSPVQN